MGAKEMVRDPEFQALPWAERHQLLALKDPEYAALPKGDQAGVMNALKTKDYWKPAAPAKEEKPSIRKRVADFVRPTLEGGGTLAGEAMGAVLSPFTAGASIPVLAGGGMAAGSGLADVIEGKPTSFAEMGRDMKTGAMSAMGGQLFGAGASAALNTEAGKKAIIGAGNAADKVASTTSRTLAALKSPIQTRANNRAKETLSSLKDLSTQEARNLAQAEQLTSRLGVKLNPASMTGKPSAAAMEQGLATADPSFAGALNAQDAVAKQAALGRIRQATGKAKPLPAAQDMATTGQSTVAAVKSSDAKAKAVHERLYADLPNTTHNTDKISEAVAKMESSFRPGDESVFPSRAISRIKEAITTAPLKLNNAQRMEKSLLNVKYVPEPKTVGFQDLHSLRKDVGRQITDALSGPQPNRELAANLIKLKGVIDETIDLNMGTSEKYKAAKDAFVDYANTYRTGAVAKTLQRGREASGLRTADENIGRQFFTPSGSTGLIKAVGQAAAKEQMRPFVIADMLKTASPDGVNFNVQSGINYIQKNRAVLERLRLTDDARQVLKDQFPGELEKIIAKRAPDAATGAQFPTSNDMRGILQKYGNTIKQLYGAETLNAYRDYNQLMTMIERKNVVPRGGNSNTAEKAMNLANLMIKESAGPAKRLTDGLAVAIAKGATGGGGVGFASGGNSMTGAALGGGIMAARQVLSNASSQEAKAFVKILQDATLNPQIGRDLMRLQRTGKVPDTLQIIIDRNLAGGTAAGVSGGE